jgi:hypothetical protein
MNMGFGTWNIRSLYGAGSLMTVLKEDKMDYVKGSFCEHLGRVFDKFLKYHMIILLRDINTKVGWENIFKPTIGN